MPARKIKKSPSKDILLKVTKGIWAVLVQIWIALKAILIVLERVLKIVAIFLIAISASILFLIASFYLFGAAFGLKDSPAFQDLRDRIAEVYTGALEDDLQEIEAELQDDNTENN